jgi:uncharacterized repeat protein (TIGR03803 family)
MRRKHSSICMYAPFAIITVALLATSAWGAPREKVLWNFCPVYGCKDGEAPYGGGMIFDASGNLYGVTYDGGAFEDGVVFELIPSADGKWTEKVLHSFTGYDGDGPFGPLIFDAAGNLYGTTVAGGAYFDGVAFQLTPDAGGAWTEKVLHNFGFSKGDKGFFPWAGLALDAAGNLYGTTSSGGAYEGSCGGYACGVVFQLKRGSNGQWTEKVLHSFQHNGKDGFDADDVGVTIDASGNLYGTTQAGGAPGTGCGGYGCGTIFELTPGANGKWTEKVLHSFNGKDGANPDATLILDSAGNLYGTTTSGGAVGCDGNSGCGTVFELMPGANGKWTEKVLRSFFRPREPLGGVIFDAAGNLYGTTLDGGRYCCGTVFELSPGANGKWTETVLHSFGQRDGSLGDGVSPTGNLIFDAHGNLYGTTVWGGNIGVQGCGGGCGTVFEITP